MPFFASAQPADTSANLGIMLVSLFFLAAAAALAVPPIRIARHRKHRFAEAILAGTLLWCALAAGSAIVTVLAQSHYSEQHALDMMTGLRDPNDFSDKPAYPWLLWLCLGIAYGLLIAFAALGKRADPPPAPDSAPGKPADQEDS